MMRRLKDALYGVKKRLCASLPAGLLVVGAAVISRGIWMICKPAGIIASGGLMIAFGVLLIMGGGDKQ